VPGEININHCSQCYDNKHHLHLSDHIIIVGCSNKTAKTISNQQDNNKDVFFYFKNYSCRTFVCTGRINQNHAKIFLNKLHRMRQIEFEPADTIGVADQGANFESVACNLSGPNIEIEHW